MLKIEKKSNTRVDIGLSGALDSQAMREGLDALIKASEDVEHGVMLYRIENFSLPTFGALSVEFGKLPELFSLLGKYDRCAVLCDRAWLRAAAEFEGALIPGLSIKAFQLGETAAAEAWLEAE